MYAHAVQNDAEIKLNIVLYIKVIFIGQGVGIEMAYMPLQIFVYMHTTLLTAGITIFCLS